MLDHILRGQYASRSQAGNQMEQFKLLNWNIERGLDLPGVMAVMRKQQPDVCVFQEVDLHARRTGLRDVADLLARQFEFNYVFGIEFEELSQGSNTERAYQGQAVFARCPIEAPRILRFGRQSSYWRPRRFLPRWPVFQPRHGGRMALAAELVIGLTRLIIYNLHLESQGCDDLRLWQLSEVVQDSLQYSDDTPVVVAGDLNTRNAPSPLRDFLLASGFRDACGGRTCRGTKANGQTLDWIFVRGAAESSGTRVHRDISASDHYPLSTNLSLIC